MKDDSDTYTAEKEDSQNRYWLREKTFSDEGLASLGAVGVRANGLLETYRLPAREIPIRLPELFIVELLNRSSNTNSSEK